MATLRMPGPVFKISAANTYKLTNPSDEGESGGVYIQIVNDGTFSGSIVVSGQSQAIDRAGGTDSIQAIPYRSINVNGTAGTGAFVTTALTTNSIIYVPGDFTPALVVTYTSGSCSVYVRPVTGSAAF